MLTSGNLRVNVTRDDGTGPWSRIGNRRQNLIAYVSAIFIIPGPDFRKIL